jgi:hypothetical protein
MAWRARSARSAPGSSLAPPGLLVVLNDGSEAAQRAARLATRLAAAMPTAWRVHQWPVADAATLDALLQRPPPLDALVMPRSLATRERWARLARLGCPVLLIG